LNFLSAVKCFSTLRGDKAHHIWGYCVLASVLNPNCYFHIEFYPNCLETKPHFTPTPSAAHNSIKEDNFTLANIPLLFLELCEYTLICHYILAAFQ